MELRYAESSTALTGAAVSLTGEPVIFDEIYRRHATLMYSVAYRILGDSATAEDAVQDSLMQVWRHADRYDPSHSALQTWLLTIVRRRCIDLLRRRAARPLTAGPVDENVGDSLRTDDPWVETERTLTREQIQGALGSLPAEQRETIELAYFSGLTAVEIAGKTGAPLGTVKGRMRLGLHKLKEALS